MEQSLFYCLPYFYHQIKHIKQRDKNKTKNGKIAFMNIKKPLQIV